MKRLLFSRPDGGVTIVVPNSKEKIEQVLGPMTQEEYEAHVTERSIPDWGTQVRSVDIEDLPVSREFRNAWRDVKPGTQVDICCERARDIQLGRLRAAREPHWEKLDREFMLAIETGSDLSEVVSKKQVLRDITEPLKALKVRGKFNDEAILDQIRSLGQLNV